MALTKIPRGLLDTGIADSSDATAITIDSSENVTTAAALATGGNLTVNGNTNLTGNLTVDSSTLYLDSSNNKIGIGTLFTGGNANSVMVAPLNIKLASGSSAAVATFNLEHSNQSANIEQRLQFNAGDDATADSYSNMGYIAFGKENSYVTDDTRDSYLTFATSTNAIQAERMRINSAGNVGIGLTNPASALDVTSSASDVVFLRSSQSTTTNVYITNTNATTSNTANLYFAPANNVAGALISTIAMEDFSTSANRTADLAFSTRKDGTMTERMRIDNGGNLGAGTTSPLLRVTSVDSGTGGISTSGNVGVTHGNANILIGAHNENNSATYSGIALETRTSGASRWLIANEWKSTYLGDLVFSRRTGGTSSAEAMRIDSSGNLGIGTTSPNIFSFSGATNHVGIQASGTNQWGLLTIAGTGTGAAGISLGAGSVRHALVASTNGSDLAFYTNASNSGTSLTERVRITDDGKVGIGSSSPYSNAALTVIGGIRFSTSVWSSGNAFNVTSWATYNNNNENSVGAVYNKLCFLTIYHSNGFSMVPIISNAGGGVAYQFTCIRPDSATAEHGAIDFTVTTDGSAGNAFRIRIGSGNGNLSVERTSGSTTFGLALHVLSG